MSPDELAKVDKTISSNDDEMASDAIEKLRRELTMALESAKAEEDEDDDYMLGGRQPCPFFFFCFL